MRSVKSFAGWCLYWNAMDWAEGPGYVSYGWRLNS